MREIKFRAWDKQSKRMLEVSTFYTNIDKNRRIMVFGTEEDNKKRIEGGGSISVTADGKPFTYGTLQIQLNDFELMQFTGLLDRHGKEIYEGDIFKSEVEANPYTSICEYKNGGFTIPVIEGKGDCEVIGNIYENPELLKE